MARCEAAFEILRAAFPTDVVAVEMGGVHPYAVVESARWHEIARFLRDDPRLGVNWLRCITAVDHIEDKRFALVYEFHAIEAAGGTEARRHVGTEGGRERNSDEATKRRSDGAGENWGNGARTGGSSGGGGAGSSQRSRGEFWAARHEFAIRVLIDRDNPRIASVADVWPAANWHEREAFDLFGIVFDGHPDLRRILCCDDWVGFPLRKDYEFPREYHGIPGSTEFAQSRIEH